MKRPISDWILGSYATFILVGYVLFVSYAFYDLTGYSWMIPVTMGIIVVIIICIWWLLRREPVVDIVVWVMYGLLGLQFALFAYADHRSVTPGENLFTPFLYDILVAIWYIGFGILLRYLMKVAARQEAERRNKEIENNNLQ